jgi:hypothetical protein
MLIMVDNETKQDGKNNQENEFEKVMEMAVKIDNPPDVDRRMDEVMEDMDK